MDQRQTTAPAGADGADPPGEDPGTRTEGGPSSTCPRRRGAPAPHDLSALFALVDALRRLVPPELQDRVTRSSASCCSPPAR